jgi:hypothetical protein
MKSISELDEYACSLLGKMEKGSISPADAAAYANVCSLILKIKIAAHHLSRAENADNLEPESLAPAKVVTVKPHRRRQPGLVHRPSQ